MLLLDRSNILFSRFSLDSVDVSNPDPFFFTQLKIHKKLIFEFYHVGNLFCFE